MTPERQEAMRVYQAAYYQDHREAKRVSHAAYRSAHREEKRAYDATHYAAYYESHKDDILGKQAKQSAEFHEWLQVLRAVNGCADCETHEGRLRHHHIDPTTKLYNVSNMYRCSLDTLEGELEKCVVLCRPCHTKRHVEMRRP